MPKTILEFSAEEEGSLPSAGSLEKYRVVQINKTASLSLMAFDWKVRKAIQVEILAEPDTRLFPSP